jgi:hypothetical protein
LAYIYYHIRLDKNEPFYIGIGSDNKGKYTRAYSKNRNTYWKNIVNKTLYKVEIIQDNITWEYACNKEKEFISLYGRADLGLGLLVNMTDGGEGNKEPRSESTKQKMRKPKTKDHINNMKLSHINRNYSNLKKPKSNTINYKNPKINGRKPIIQYSKDNTFIKLWESITEASLNLNIGLNNIHSCLTNKTKIAKGFIFRYKLNIN